MTPLERFMSNVCKEPGGCWIWTGALDDKGYGRFWDGKQVKAHRWLYGQLVEEIPAELEPDHRCRNRACVNPEHLEPVTHAENSRRAHYFKKTCSAGHPLPEVQEGRRVCRPCANRRNRVYKQRQREQRAPRPPRPVVHGRGRYLNHGCRCEVCCVAESTYKRQRRAGAMAGGRTR